MLRLPLLLAVSFVLLLTSSARSTASPSLAERLGYKATDRLVIINGDDTGMCHAANEATFDALERGLLTSATIMVPCPWFSGVANYARRHPEKDFGIHLCHTSEWGLYRWGPLAPREKVPGLIDPEGYLWRSVEEVYAHSSPTEALEEARAQIKKALAAGIDVTHLDSHMGTLQYDLRYLEAYLQLAVEFALPVRMASQATLERFGQPELRAKFAAKGIIFPDYFVFDELKDEPKNVKAFWANILKNLKPGVTELYIHAAKPTDELKAITSTWTTRSQEYETFTNDPDIRRIIEEEKIIRLGYRPLRELQRKAGNKATE